MVCKEGEFLVQIPYGWTLRAETRLVKRQSLPEVLQSMREHRGVLA